MRDGTGRKAHVLKMAATKLVRVTGVGREVAVARAKVQDVVVGVVGREGRRDGAVARGAARDAARGAVHAGAMVLHQRLQPM